MAHGRDVFVYGLTSGLNKSLDRATCMIIRLNGFSGLDIRERKCMNR